MSIIITSALLVAAIFFSTVIVVVSLGWQDGDSHSILNQSVPANEIKLRHIHINEGRLNTDIGAEAANVKKRISRVGASPLPPCVTPEDVTVITSDKRPDQQKFMPEVGNGHIATVVQSDSIFMNGLYNGANTSSHRARISSTSGYSIVSTKPAGLKRVYTLDMGRGFFAESYSGPGINITLRTYAHRTLTRVLVSELVMMRDDVNTTVGVTVHLNKGEPSEDVDLTKDILGTMRGLIREPEYPDFAPPTEFYVLTQSLEGKTSMSDGVLVESFLGMTAMDVDRSNILGEYAIAKEAFEDGELLNQHVKEWNKIWEKGRIDVEGNITLARITYASLYYLLSSLPFMENLQWPFVGLSPGGLARGTNHNDDYSGHVFWDQDVWMFPSLALLHPDIGRLIVQTRNRTLKAARLIAKNTGYEGARYPWESAFTGLETCPGEPYSELEIHVTGDVALMFKQYWQLTHDKHLMFNKSGAELVWDIAKFWASRVIYMPEDDKYHILDVMPPDEWHFPVNDSAYTNNLAQISLRFANDLKRAARMAENTTWATIADKMYLPYDDKRDFHPEFEGFHVMDVTKQADVVLLGYPLMVDMDGMTRENDLRIYEKSTPVGPAPAMTWGMFALGWLELGNETKAAELFNRSILNVQEPFLVWSENSDGTGATNFQTGMGGYLQSVLFGYGGIRLFDDRMTFNPKLIRNNVTKITFTGINYRGGVLDLSYNTDTLNLTLTSVGSGHPGLEIKYEGQTTWWKLTVGKTITVKRQNFDIRSLERF